MILLCPSSPESPEIGFVRGEFDPLEKFFGAWVVLG